MPVASSPSQPLNESDQSHAGFEVALAVVSGGGGSKSSRWQTSPPTRRYVAGLHASSAIDHCPLMATSTSPGSPRAPCTACTSCTPCTPCTRLRYPPPPPPPSRPTKAKGPYPPRVLLPLGQQHGGRARDPFSTCKSATGAHGPRALRRVSFHGMERGKLRSCVRASGCT